MTADDRYDVSGLPEAQFEPGSHGLVLKNLLRITSRHIMDEAEARALEQAMDVLVRSAENVPGVFSRVWTLGGANFMEPAGCRKRFVTVC